MRGRAFRVQEWIVAFVIATALLQVACTVAHGGNVGIVEIIGRAGSEEIRLTLDLPSDGTHRIDGVLTGHEPRLDLLETPTPVELSRYEDLPVDRSWSTMVELGAGVHTLEPGWSVAGLAPGEYTFSLRVTSQGAAPIEEEHLIRLGGVEVSPSGEPVVGVGAVTTVSVSLTNMYDRALDGSEFDLHIEPIAMDANEEPGSDALQVVYEGIRLPELLAPGQTVQVEAQVTASEPGPYLLRVHVTDGEGTSLGRAVHRFAAVDPATLLPEVYAGQPLVERLPIADWAYAASIGKIYNLKNILLLPRVLEEMKSHGVSVFSWGTHSEGDFLALPYYNDRAHAQGFATLGYTGALGLEDDRFVSRYDAAQDWVLRNRDGSMPRPWGGVPFAPASPYYERYRAPFFRSVVQHLDGVFADISHLYGGTDYSPFSLAEFAQDHPDIDPQAALPGSDEYWRFNEWRYETVARFAARVRDDMKATQPDTVVSWNMAETIGRIAWGRTFAIDAVRLGKVVDVPLVETNYVSGEPPWILGANARYYGLAAPGKPIWVALAFEYPDKSLFTPAQVELTMAEIYANGASVYIDWTPVSETLNPNTEWILAADRIFNFVQNHRDLFVHRDTRSAARVGILYSQQSNDYWNNPGGVSANPSYQQEFLAWYLLLLEEGIQADVINYETLADAQTLAAKYDAVVLPSAAALSDAQLDALQSFLAGGGRVLSTFQTGTLDERGHVRRDTKMWQWLGLEQDLDASVAEIAVHQVGEGILAHVTNPVGQAYWRRNDDGLRGRMLRALDAANLHAAKASDLALSDTTGSQGRPQVESVVYEDQDGLLVHLVNWTTDVGDWHALSHSYQDGNDEFTPITAVHGLQQLKLSVHVPDGREVLAVHYAGVGTDDQTLQFVQNDTNSVEVIVPELHSYGIVRVILSE